MPKLSRFLAVTVAIAALVPSAAIRTNAQTPTRTPVQTPARTTAPTLAPLPSFQPEWVRDFPPFRIAGNLYYVGTYDLASYLITTPAGDILINTGCFTITIPSNWAAWSLSCSTTPATPTTR
ncbi:MAG TPA: hypothetical protein VL978_08905 [Puia sp.]|nr:hypothetical protein [Puia sp.]